MMPNYITLLKLLKPTDLKKLKEYAASLIGPYNELIKHSPCQTDPNRKPCQTTDKGEPLCAQTLEDSSVLKIVRGNLCEGNYSPPTRGQNALAGQNDIMDKPPKEQKEFTVKTMKKGIENYVYCLPMPCRKNICDKGMVGDKKLYRVVHEKAKKECQIHHLELSPDELIERTIAKRLLKPSFCFPRPDGQKITLENVICENISGEAKDIGKKNSENPLDEDNRSTKEVEEISSEDFSTEDLTIQLEELKEKLIEQQQVGELLYKQVEALIRKIRDEISRTVKTPKTKERVLNIFDTIIEDRGTALPENECIKLIDIINRLAPVVQLNDRQIKHCLGGHLQPILLQHQEEIRSLFQKVLHCRQGTRTLCQETDEIYRNLCGKDDELDKDDELLEKRLENLEVELSDENILHAFTTLEKLSQERSK